MQYAKNLIYQISMAVVCFCHVVNVNLFFDETGS